MNLFKKIGIAVVGMAMAVGVGVAVGSKPEARVANAAIETYNRVDSLTAGDEVLIVTTKSGTNYVLPAADTSSAPGVNLTVVITNNSITADLDSNLFTVGGNADAWTFKNSSGSYLYTTGANNGVRIGGTSDTWSLTTKTNGFAMQEANNSRYLGVYNTQDWRSYTSSNASNYGGNGGSGESIKFFKKAAPSTDPDFSIDKNSVSLTLGGSSTTVTATPNAYVSQEAEYSWSRTAGDDCVTLTNANTATVTIAPKGTAVFASCTLTIAVTGCTSKTVSVSVKKVSSSGNPFTVAEAKVVIDDGDSSDKTGVYVHGIISQVDSYSSNTITYWISDDGTTTDQFEVYKGKGLNNANFNAKGDLAVGYEVTVYGSITLYSSSVYEFSSGNYLTSLILPDSHSVSTTTVGLTLDKDNISSSGGTIAMTTASKMKGTNVVVGGTATSSINKNIVTLSDVSTDITIDCDIVDAEVASITLSGQTTKFGLDTPFTFDGTVTGTYDDWCASHTQEVLASGYVVDDSNFRQGVEGTYSITVTYGSASKSYDVTVADVFDSSKGEYHKVTNLNQLYDGAHVAIVDADEEYSMLNGFTSTNNVTATSVTKDDVTNTISKTNVLDIELVKTSNNEYRFKLDDDLYLYAASSGSNHLKASSLATTGDNGKFLISLSSETFSIVAQGSYTRNVMRFNPNNGNPVFSCYASSSTTGTTPAIYVFETYENEAKTYAETFIKGNGSANTCAATISNWNTLGTAFGKLTTGAQSIFEEATHNAPETYTTPNEYTVEHAVARYDDALQKHIDLRSNEFMGRVAAGTLVYSNARIVDPTNALQSDNESASTVAIITISIVSLAAVGGYFFLRRRKEI